MSADKNNFFSMLKSLYSKTPMIYKDFPLYLVLLWLSHDRDSFDYVEKISKYIYVINEKHCIRYLYYKLPYSKNKFLKWSKKASLDNENVITELCNQYGISQYEAKLYVS